METLLGIGCVIFLLGMIGAPFWWLLIDIAYKVHRVIGVRRLCRFVWQSGMPKLIVCALWAALTGKADREFGQKGGAL